MKYKSGGIITSGHNLIGVVGFEDLWHCTRCNCAEGTLPTTCPGVRVPYRVQNMIIKGVVDFVGDRWVGKRRPLRISIRLGSSVEELGGSLQRMSKMFREALPSIADFTRATRPEPITPEMVREALAHVPVVLSNPERWEWLAGFLNYAVKNPGEPCPCCNVTPDGDICDHLPGPPPLVRFRQNFADER